MGVHDLQVPFPVPLSRSSVFRIFFVLLLMRCLFKWPHYKYCCVGSSKPSFSRCLSRFLSSINVRQIIHKNLKMKHSQVNSKISSVNIPHSLSLPVAFHKGITHASQSTTDCRAIGMFPGPSKTRELLIQLESSSSQFLSSLCSSELNQSRNLALNLVWIQMLRSWMSYSKNKDGWEDGCSFSQ